MKIVVGNETKHYLCGIPAPKSWQGLPKRINSRICEQIGFPLVAKIPLFIHKTEKKAVHVAHNQDELNKILKNFDIIARKEKMPSYQVLLQEFVNGIELIAGLKKNSTFGHVIMLGLGGIFVEVFKDISFRVCPITHIDAKQMIEELKSKRILEGVRGLPCTNKQALIDALVKLSMLPKKYPLITELDINPLISNQKNVFAVDVRIILES